jgi:hypothetical protein
MRAFMIISRPIIAGLAVFLAATSAHAAVSSTHRFSEAFAPNPGVLTGNTLSGLAVGDLFGVEIDLTTVSGDGFVSIFTYLTYDPAALQLVDGFTDASGIGPDLGTVPTRNQVAILGAPAPAAGQPAGTGIGLALGVSNPTTGNGQYNGVLNGAVIAFAQFKVLSTSGSSQINHVETGFSDIRAGGPLAFSGPLTVTVPEPATWATGLTALASVAGVIAARKRLLRS